jgi:hypothetical protein
MFVKTDLKVTEAFVIQDSLKALDELTWDEVDEWRGLLLSLPSCEHGLSAWLCEGPQHYPMDPPF